MLEAQHAGSGGCLALGADIDAARRVFPHQHHRKARRAPCGGGKARHRIGHPRPQFLGERLAVDDCRRHLFPLPASASSRATIISAGPSSLTCLSLADAPETSEAERSEEHTSELQSLMRNSYADFCLKKKKH